MTLIKNLSILRKTQTTVKTKEGKSYNGIIVKIDSKMNISLRNVELTFKKNVSKLDNVVIKGSDIRYFTIDEKVNLKKIVEDKRYKRFSKKNK